MAIVIGAHSIRSAADGVSRFIMTETTVVANVVHPVQIGQFGHDPAAEWIDNPMNIIRKIENPAPTRFRVGSFP